VALRSAKATLYYTLKGDVNGEEFHPSTTFYGFRYCDITATQDIEIESLVGQVVGTVAEESSSFATTDTNVNKLYSNVKWGQRGNFLSIPTDCPQRDERLGWAGDIQIFGRTATYNADLASFFHKWMGDMRDSQRSDGAYPSVAPYTWGVPYGAAAWAEAGLVVPWNTYLMYGDKGILEENFESMEKYMTFLSNQAGGGYQYNGPGTDYGDWVAYVETDRRYISVCYYAYAASLMEKMSLALSQTENDSYAQKAQSYRTLYNNIRTEFQHR
jgi:alpha-L-rhamnosidase